VPSIQYYAEHFGSHWGSQLQGWQTLNVDWRDIIWAAISVGKMSYSDLFTHGQFSVDDIRSREFLVYANLMGNGVHVCRSPLYETLDPSEKSAVSYFIGMMSAKIVGMYLLDTPWLVHLEKIRSLYNIRLIGTSKPDLIGENKNGDWIIVEAKGRTNGFSQDAIDKAKKQTRQVRNISGQLPMLRVAVESYFGSNLNIHICDPKDYDDDAIDIPLESNQFFGSYYKPFLSLMDYRSRKQQIGNDIFLFSDEESLGLSIGLNAEVFQLAKDGKVELQKLKQLSSTITGLKVIDSREIIFYPDGIAIKCDERWSEKSMKLDPRERTQK
jgi:hypothetical protein